MESITNELTNTPDKPSALVPFAMAVAEAMSTRSIWLDKVKQARWKSRTITHEEYAVIYCAYVKAKHRVRDAVSEYNRAKDEIENGVIPKLKPDLMNWLSMNGINYA